MPQPDPNGRLAALQTASQGQPASPGANPPMEPPPQGGPEESPLGPNVEPGMPDQLEERAQAQATQQATESLLARVSVLEQALVAKGVVGAQDLNPLAPPSDPSQLGLPGLQGGVDTPGAPVPPGAGPPPGGLGAAPQPRGAGPNQPY